MIPLTQPQELEAFYIIPSLRRELAKAMLKKGLEQKEIAKRLSVTEAAVSQYMHDKRGTDVEFDENMQQSIADAAEKITSQNLLIKHIQQLLTLIWDKRIICTVCRDHNPSIPKECVVCFT